MDLHIIYAQFSTATQIWNHSFNCILRFRGPGLACKLGFWHSRGSQGNFKGSSQPLLTVLEPLIMTHSHTLHSYKDRHRQTDIHTHIHTHTHTHTLKHACTHACLYAHTHACTHTHTHIHPPHWHTHTTHTHKHTHVCVHMHACTHMHVRRQNIRQPYDWGTD